MNGVNAASVILAAALSVASKRDESKKLEKRPPADSAAFNSLAQ
jgi:hypothetical protein